MRSRGLEFFDTGNGEGKLFLTFDLALDLNIWKFGVGPGRPIRVDVEDGKIRKEDRDEPSDYVDIVKYIRYGKKGDTLYSRIVSVPVFSLGHGAVDDSLGAVAINRQRASQYIPCYLTRKPARRLSLSS